MRIYKMSQIVNLFLFVSLIGVFGYISKYRIPSFDFSCEYHMFRLEPFAIPLDTYNPPSRNPFFIPLKEVKVSVEKVDESTKKVAQEATGLFVYKGMMDWGDEKVAIIYVLEDKKTKFLKLGDFVKGYKVLDITEDAVVLSKEGGLSLITLKIGGSK